MKQGPVLTKAGSTLHHRGPEGLAIYRTDAGEARLFIGFATGVEGDRRSSVFYKEALVRAVPDRRPLVGRRSLADRTPSRVAPPAQVSPRTRCGLPVFTVTSLTGTVLSVGGGIAPYPPTTAEPGMRG